MKNKICKNSKEIYEEEKTEVNNLKPMTIIDKPDKNDFYKTNQKEIPEPSTNNRIKAFNLMKQRNSSQKESVKLNNTNSSAGLETNCNKEIPQDKLSIISKNQVDLLYNRPNINYTKNNFPNISLSYVLGANLSINSNSQNIQDNSHQSSQIEHHNSIDNIDSLLCFHKKEKWIAYLHNYLIIIEYFDREKDNSGHLNHAYSSRQKILNNASKNFCLNCIKLSENGKILMAYSSHGENIGKTAFSACSKKSSKKEAVGIGPIILFYSYKKVSEDQDEFELINKINLKHAYIKSCEISHQSNICLVLSTNTRKETFVSLLDFQSQKNEILTTTVIDINYKAIKWNPYLTNFEFCSLADSVYTFWRFNTSEITLQYQHGAFDNKIFSDSESGKKFTCMDFTPPLGSGSVILLLITLTNGELWGVDTRTNSVNLKYTLSLPFILRDKVYVTKIVCSLRYITLISSNKIVVIDWINSKEKDYSEILNVFSKLSSDEVDSTLIINKSIEPQSKDYSTIELDSEIISYDSDLHSSDGISLTKKGSLFCISSKEKLSFRLFSFIENKSTILQAKIISKDIANQFYNVRNINLDNFQLEEIPSENELKSNQFLLITAHKFGVIKIWSVPEYQLLSNFEVCTEEILTFDITTNDTKLAVSYNSNYLRIFDFAEDKFLGKFRSISNSSYKILKFLQDKFFLYAVDLNNTVFLIKIEDYKNLIVQVHQILNLPGDVVEFKLRILESYNKFLVNLQNVYLHVYNRKFTNILKNYTYDNSVPVFYLQDKFNPDEYFRTGEDRKFFQNENKTEEYFKFEFSANDRDLVFLMSHARGMVLIRNFELHTIEKVVKISESPLDFLMSPNFDFVIFVYKNKIRLNRDFSENAIDYDLLCGFRSACLANKNYSCVSSNGKLFVIFFENRIYFYNITEKLNIN